MLLILSFCVLYVMRCTFCARCRRCPLLLRHNCSDTARYDTASGLPANTPPRGGRAGRECSETGAGSTVCCDVISKVLPRYAHTSIAGRAPSSTTPLARRWPLWQRPCYTRALGGRLNFYRGTCRRCRSGEMGRHVGFKIRCGKTRAGSSPASGTISGKIIRRNTLPTISMFYGIIILMYFYDNKRHSIPHIHAEYA